MSFFRTAAFLRWKKQLPLCYSFSGFVCELLPMCISFACDCWWLLSVAAPKSLASPLHNAVLGSVPAAGVRCCQSVAAFAFWDAALAVAVARGCLDPLFFFADAVLRCCHE